MNRSMLGLLICLGGCLLLSACVAELIGGELVGEAALEAAAGEAVEAAAVEGAMEAAAEGAELEGAVVEGEVEAGLLRTRPGAMSEFLERVTEGGEARPLLEVDRAGRVSVNGRLVAEVGRQGELVSEIRGQRMLVGRIYDGRIWEVTTGGELASPVGEIGGYIPGDGLLLRAEPNSFSARVGLLRSDVVADILRIERGWYEIRLRNGTTGWIRAPFLAIVTTLYAAARRRDDDSEPEDPRLFLTSGRVLRASVAKENEGAVVAMGADGQPVVLDRSLLANERRLQWDWGSRAERTTLSNGMVLLASLREENGAAALLDLPNGEKVVLDGSLLKDHTAPGEPSMDSEFPAEATDEEEEEQPTPEPSPAEVPVEAEDACRLPISVEPDDATVYLDGSFAGTGAELKQDGLPLGRGAHRLAVVRPGYQAQEILLHLRSCGEQSLAIDLERDRR